jgi:adenylate cyclase
LSPASPGRAAGRGRCIVCVDDERIILSGLKDQLRSRFGGALKIELAESGEEGLEVLEELRGRGVEVPVVISDQLMPGMKGDEFLAKVHGIDPRIRTILLTGQATAEAVGEAVNKAQLYRFIAKPWSEEDLALTVREAIRAHEIGIEVDRKEAELRAAQTAALRFVPKEFLTLLGRDRVEDARPGDFIERRMHVLFSDLRGFTTLVEQLGAHRADALVRAWADDMDQVVREAGGFINNIEGDAVLALFPGEADAALRAGVRACQRLQDENARRSSAGAPRLAMGLGVTTGALLLGVIGSEERLQCDLVGHVVDEASALERLTKAWGTPMLLSRATARALSPAARDALRELGAAPLAEDWAEEPIYEALDALPAPVAARRRSTRADFSLARAALAEGRTDDARASFARVLEADPDDAAARRLLATCAGGDAAAGAREP